MAPCSCPSSVLCLLPSLLLLLQLPQGDSQEKFRVFGPTKPIVAELGKDITLSCSLDPAMSAKNMEVRWFRSHFSESVFTYQDGQEQNEEQMAQYAGRTSLIGEYLKEGEASVRIHKVQAADNGLYTCFFRNGAFVGQARLELQVAGVGSAPHVHITGPEEDGVHVVCMVSGWFPEPQVQWRDPRGEQFLEFSKVQAQDTEGLFSVEAAVVVRDSSAGSVTCSILNPVLHQEKAMAIVIPKPFFPRTSPWKPAFLVILPLLLLLLLGAACYTWREHSTQMWLLHGNIHQAKEKDRQTKEEALKDTDELQSILDRRKAAYLAAWRKAQLYADWRKEKFQAWPVTLDPGYCVPDIFLSHDKKSLSCHHDGIGGGYSVWGLEGITSGRCYWEVKVRKAGRTAWALGVRRKDETTRYTAPSPLTGKWAIGRISNVFQAFTDPDTPLHRRQVPHRVGVFLDYAHGDVSFYDMTDGSHIFSFPPESFSGILLPYFTCYSGHVSMTICPLEAGPKKPSVPIDNPPSLEEPVSHPGEGIPSGSGVDGAPPGPEAPLLPCTPETMSP